MTSVSPVHDSAVVTGDLWSLLRRQQIQTPELPAVSDGVHQFTYSELYLRVAHLARELETRNVGDGDIVGVALPRSAELIVAMLAVLRVGAAYLPLDPTDPPARLAYVAEDAKPCLVLTSSLTGALPSVISAIPRLDTSRIDQIMDPETMRSAVDLAGPQAIDPRLAAYIIYTSGSTGRPKGVVNVHGAIANRLRWMRDHYRVGPGDSILQKTPTSFDVSVWELFLPLISGARLVFAKPGGHHDPAYLAGLIAEEKITIIHFVPSMLAAFIRERGASNCRSLRQVICSGEALPQFVRRGLQKRLDVPVDNLYGPTEAAIDVSVWPCTDTIDQAWEPIGYPIENIELLVLDEELGIVPDNCVGELYISGVGLARGYQARPELTAERFVANPYGPPGSRMYRTGDLVRRNKDGRLDYLGRNDDQIKIRGHRIELGEIEEVMTRHRSVEQAVAVVRWHNREGGEQDGHIAAYFVPAPEHRDAPSARNELSAYLSECLPLYMVPATVTGIASIPLNANGKLDRDALPVVPIEGTAPYEAPNSEAEGILCDLVEEILRVEQVGVNDNFFEIGGTSLDAVRLTHKVQAVTGLTLELDGVFEAQTMRDLSTYLHERAIRPPIIRQEPQQFEELSFAQQRLWFMYQLDVESASYHIPFRLHFRGPVDARALEAAFRDVLHRHDVLGSTYPVVDGVPFQRSAPELGRAFCLGRREVERHRIDEECVNFANRRFDLAVELPLRAQLWQVRSGGTVLVVVAHHIAADGWSFWPLHADLLTAYRARRAGRPPTWPELPVRYSDYAAWQRRLFKTREAGDAGGLARTQREYWLEKLADMPSELELPTDRPRPETASYRGGFADIEVPPSIHKKVVVLAGAARATSQMVLQAVFAALLAQLSSTNDIRIGVATAGRPDGSLEDVVGFFVNTLVMRLNLSGNPSFEEILERTKATNVEAFGHGDLPFEELVRLLNPPRSSGRHPLVQVMMAEQNAPSQFDFDGVAVDVEPVITPAAKFDLSLKVAERFDQTKEPNGIVGGLEYNGDLFDRSTVERFARWYEDLLRRVVEDPRKRLSELPLMNEDQCAAVLSFGQGEDTHREASDTIADLFESQARRCPDAVALIQGEFRTTYQELDEWANAIAHELRDHGVAPDDRVGLCVDRSPLMVVTVIAIWKVGAAYVPLDVKSPPDRLRYMLNDSGVTVAVVDDRGRAVLDNVSDLLLLTWDAHHGTREPGPPRSQRSPEQLAYTIYTSGTTGRPKAVMIEQGSVVRRLGDVTREFALTSEDVSIQVISIVFEPAVREIFAPLLCGGSVIILEQGPDYGPQAIAHALCTHRPTVILCIVPSVLDAVMTCVGDDLFANDLRIVGAAGEELHPALARRVSETWQCEVVNQYGPTECTMMTTLVSVSGTDGAVQLPVGRPLPDTCVMVLDEWLRPTPIGVTGEIYIGGAGLARGYSGRPALTASRFVANPFGGPGERMYRTGDLGRWNKEGCLEYEGRSDTQVKVRGYRVELGELEAALLRQEHVLKAAAVAQNGPTGDVRLVAYVVSDARGPLDGAVLKDALRGWLPDYMIPYAVVVLDDLPLRGNGKLNHQLLPAPTPDAPSGRGARTPREELMCEIIAAELGLSQVSIDSDFFEMGGHSLLAAKVVAGFRKALGVAVPIHYLFDSPTVAGLSERLDGSDTSSGLEVVLPLRVGRDLPPLFCVHAGGGLSWPYAGLLHFINDGRPIFGIQARGLLTPDSMPSSIEEMAADYAEVITCLQPEGPYHLLGWSFGGLVAHEMAVVLQQRGDEIGLLALLDAYPDVPDFMRVNLSRIIASLVGSQVGAQDIEGLELDEVIELLGREGSVFAHLPRDSRYAIVQTLQHNRTLASEFAPRVYHGSVAFFTALRERPEDASVHRAWSPYVEGSIVNASIDCDHMGMMSPDALETIGPLLAKSLRRECAYDESI